ncbi:MAG: tetratricopeptide repeat protein [Thermoanaerobaculum sp.]
MLYRGALRLNPQFVDAVLALARAELAEGHLEKAKRLVHKASKLSPQDPRVQALKEELAGRANR